MEKIDLSNQDIDDIALAKVCDWLVRSRSNVEILKLSRNRITDAGLKHLLKCLQNKPMIHTLNITYNNLSS